MDVRAGTMLSVALLSAGCASLPTAPDYTRPGMLLGDMPAAVGARSMAQGTGDGRPGASAFPSLESTAGGGPQNAALTHQAVLGVIDHVQVSLATTTSGLSRLAARTTGAGMSEAPKHHLLPQENRAWFEQRGFKGAMDIDQFCVRLEQARHEAIHGGGNWRLGRTWPGEWSRMIMKTLREAEAEAGRMLTRNEILNIVGGRMKEYKIPMIFVAGRGR